MFRFSTSYKKWKARRRLMQSGAWIDRTACISGEISVGRGTKIHENVDIVGPVKIGNYCAIARNVVFQAKNHSTGYASIQSKLYQTHFGCNLYEADKVGIEIGSDVWIGVNVIICAGVRVGAGAVIGAGAVVTKDVPPYCIAAGVPAKVVKKRFNEDIRSYFCSLKWWDKTDVWIKNNREFFVTDISQASLDDIKQLISK